MEGLKIIVYFVIQQWCTRSTDTFLLSGASCPVRHPCNCVGGIADCSSRKLNTIPQLYTPATHPPSIIFWLDGNEFKTIPANTFLSMASLKGTSVSLELSTNQISYIDENAFAGIEQLVVFLGLSENKLTSLPKALATLQTLRMLYIYGNPLRTLDASVLSALSSTLADFHFSGDSFDTFPKEISFLTSLESLMMSDVTVLIEDDVFDGFKHSLKVLEIDQYIYDVPPALCRLEVLESFFFYRQNFGKPPAYQSDPIFPPCNNTMSSVRSLIVEDEYLTAFSGHIFKVFPSLTHLSFKSNIGRIDNRDIPLHCQLDLLNMNGNGFKEIPWAFNVLANLTELYLADNQIQEINSGELSRLTKLQVLDLSSNQIGYISNDAFVGNSNLRVLFLDDNELTVIPAAVTSLNSLTTLHLEDNRFRCDCTTLNNVTTWNVDALAFPSLCYGNQNNTIKAFIKDSLSKCP